VKTVKKITAKKKLALEQETVRVRDNLMMQMGKKRRLDALEDTDNDDDTVLNENDDLPRLHSPFIPSVPSCSQFETLTIFFSSQGHCHCSFKRSRQQQQNDLTAFQSFAKDFEAFMQVSTAEVKVKQKRAEQVQKVKNQCVSLLDS